jgi:hypothetical protein
VEFVLVSPDIRHSATVGFRMKVIRRGGSDWWEGRGRVLVYS